MRYGDLDLRQLNELVRIIGRCLGKLPLPTRTSLRLDRDDLRGDQEHLAMPRMPRLGAQSALMAGAGWPFRIRRIRGGWTIGVAAVLRHVSFERGDPHGLLLDNGKQMDDQLAHDERCLSPTGGIQRKPC
jgi:hypothetical protein